MKLSGVLISKVATEVPKQGIEEREDYIPRPCRSHSTLSRCSLSLDNGLFKINA
jgi:hypothetical protein